MKYFPLSVLSALHLASLNTQAQTVWNYDFNSQWGGWTLSDPNSLSPGINWSKQEEGRIGGAGGNALGGNIQSAPGTNGSVSWINDSAGTFDLSAKGSSIRLQEAWSAFASQDAFASGNSEPGQIGLLSNPGLHATRKLSDSIYVGVVEKSWTGQYSSDPYPGEAVVEIGLFQDGVMADSFGTYTLTGYGARVGSQVWGQWIDFDIYFENMGGGNIGYKVGANSISYYNSAIDGDNTSIVEGSPQLMFIEEGMLSANAGLLDLSSLRPTVGYNILPGGDVSVTGATYDWSPSGNIHNGIITVPEPGSVAMLGLLGLLLRRRR